MDIEQFIKEKRYYSIFDESTYFDNCNLYDGFYSWFEENLKIYNNQGDYKNYILTKHEKFIKGYCIKNSFNSFSLYKIQYFEGFAYDKLSGKGLFHAFNINEIDENVLDFTFYFNKKDFENKEKNLTNWCGVRIPDFFIEKKRDKLINSKPLIYIYYLYLKHSLENNS